MVLTREENELLTRVGPGTPAGELLRRYWHPVAVAAELTPEQPTQFVRVLGEDLVLFQDRSGRVGLIADRCAHRGASLCYGRVEERGLSCAYHGWLFDTGGNILETPPERNDAIIRNVKQRSYPVKKFLGLYWAYFGPQPAPEIPKYDVWVRPDGRRRITVQPQLDCNWFQAMENSVDPAHLMILHQETVTHGGRKPVNTTRGFIDDVKDMDFEVTSIGITKKRLFVDGNTEEHPLIFPNILRQGNATQIRVPVDDTHTKIIYIRFEFSDEGDGENPPVEYSQPFKDPAHARHPEARFRMNNVQAQDYMAWETQGPIADRTTEHLSYSDRGIHLLRKLMKEQIEKVQRGEDPLGIVRDPNHAMIDTQLQASLEEMLAAGSHRLSGGRRNGNTAVPAAGAST